MKNALNNKTIEDFLAGTDVHETRREQNGGGLTAAVALVLFIVESLLVFWAVRQSLSIGFALFLHLIVIGLLIVYARSVKKRGGENRFALLLLLATATTGPYGAAGVLLTVLLHMLFARRAQSFEEWYDSIFPSQQATPSQQVYDNLLVGRDESNKSYSVIPFLDVLSFGSETQKRHALAKMTSGFHPNFAPAFKKALGDDSNTIRVQAATAITKIENAFMARLMQLANVLERFPKEPVVVLALAEHYDNYAYTGLLDADRERANRRKALEYYREYLALDPQSLDVRTRIGRLLMRDRAFDQACDWFRDCMGQGYGSDMISQWYSEALFECGRYDDLRAFTRSHPAAAKVAAARPQAVNEALSMWGAAGGVA